MKGNPKLIIKISVISIFIILIVGYALYEANKILTGPIINVYSPINGSSTTTSFIEISGGTKNISFISMNDSPIFVNENGDFKEKLLLSPGYNIIKLSGKDRFERTIEKRLELILLGTKSDKKETASSSEIKN